MAEWVLRCKEVFCREGRSSGAHGGCGGEREGVVEVAVLVQVRTLAHYQLELVTQAQERALRLRTDLVQGVCCFSQACYLRIVCWLRIALCSSQGGTQGHLLVAGGGQEGNWHRISVCPDLTGSSRYG